MVGSSQSVSASSNHRTQLSLPAELRALGAAVGKKFQKGTKAAQSEEKEAKEGVAVDGL